MKKYIVPPLLIISFFASVLLGQSQHIANGIIGPRGSAIQINLDGSITLKAVGGKVLVPSLPTSDPHVVNQLWSNSGVLTVSGG